MSDDSQQALHLAGKLDLLARYGSVKLSWDATARIWECLWVTGGKTYVGASDHDPERAVEDAYYRARNGQEVTP